MSSLDLSMGGPMTREDNKYAYISITQASCMQTHFV